MREESELLLAAGDKSRKDSEKDEEGAGSQGDVRGMDLD